MRVENYRTLTHLFQVQGRTYSATVKIGTMVDECVSLDDLIDSKAFPKEAAKLERDLESGRASAIVVCVDAECAELPDLKGMDSLGAVIVYKTEDIDNAVCDHGMIENAISDLEASYQRELDSARDKVARLEAISPEQAALSDATAAVLTQVFGSLK